MECGTLRGCPRRAGREHGRLGATTATAATSPPALNLERQLLRRADGRGVTSAESTMHPTQLAVLTNSKRRGISTRPRARLEQPIGTVSYHVRQLRTAGLIAPTRTQQPRGALEHF